MSWDDAAVSGRYGLVTGAEVVEQSGPRALRRYVKEGTLIRVSPGVYRVSGTPRSFRQRCMAAHLACRSQGVVSHRSAAALLGFEAVARPAAIEVTIGPGRSVHHAGLIVHRSRLVPDEVTALFGVPVTSAARTLQDLAGSVSEEVLARCVDDALRRRRTDIAQLEHALASAARRRRPGAAALRRLVEARVATGIPDSVGVARVLSWIASAGLPTPVCEFHVHAGGRLFVLDLAYPDRKVAIEYNGREFHGMRSRIDADHVRVTELELAGWLVIVVTAAHCPLETVDRIERALALRGIPGAAC